jgi:hypothetical protein
MGGEWWLAVIKTITNKDHLDDYHNYLDNLLKSLYDNNNVDDVITINDIDYIKVENNKCFLNFDFRNNKKPALIIKTRFKNILTLPSYPSIDDGIIFCSHFGDSSTSRMSSISKRNILRIQDDLIKYFSEYFDDMCDPDYL